MDDYLIFRLYGPIAAWGKIAVGSERHSYPYPTKSAILGLVAAALGIKRSEEEKLLALQSNLGFAVRIDNRGKLILDYHTTQTPVKKELKNRPHMTRRDEVLVPNLYTVLSTREYYCDALYTVVLWQRAAENGFSLSAIQNALKHPKFVLYLGRKSCPLALPIKASIIAAETLIQALKIADREFYSYEEGILRPLKKHQESSMDLYWDQDGKVGAHVDYLQRMQKDKLLSRQRWQYQERHECYQKLSFAGES